MKNQDNFLRAYRKWPKRSFAQRLYQELNDKKPYTALLMWGLVGMLLAVGLSSDLLLSRLSQPYETQVVQEQQMLAEQRRPNPALLGEQGLKAAAVRFPVPEVERLGPFDTPNAAPPTEPLLTASENQALALVVATNPAEWR